jgi:DNA-binding LytR/AlgR family response regulator
MMVAICDDEMSDAKTLKNYVESYGGRNIVLNIFNSGKSLLEAVRSGRSFDLIFLDIVMDELNGYEAAKYLSSRGSQSLIVFVTETMKYFTAGYEFAIGYTQKPIEEKKIHAFLYKAQKHYEPKKVLIKTEDDEIMVRVQDILYYEITGRNVTLHTLKGEYQFKSSLKDQIEHLPLDMFFQPHHSYLINLDKIIGVSKTNQTITLQGGASIPISRKRKDLFYNSLAKYHFLARDMDKEL